LKIVAFLFGGLEKIYYICPNQLNKYIMTELQLSMFCTNQILVLKTGMELTAQAKRFRADFKKMVGLRANASHLDVLKVIKQIYDDNGMADKFLAKIETHKAQHLLEQL
jgi:hypothetical protein